MSKICEKEYFYDENVHSCQLCKDVCGIERQEDICETKCKDYLMTSSPAPEPLTHTFKIVIIVLTVIIVIGCVVVIISCIIFKVMKRKSKPRTLKKIQAPNDKVEYLKQSPVFLHLRDNISNFESMTSNPRYVKSSALRSISITGGDGRSDGHIHQPNYPHADHQAQVSVHPDVIRRAESFFTNRSSELNFMEDEPFRNSGLGTSLCSSVEEPYCVNTDGVKPYFQVLMDSVSGYPFFRSAWKNGSTVNVGLSTHNFEFNKSVVSEQLKLLPSDYHNDLNKTKIVNV